MNIGLLRRENNAAALMRLQNSRSFLVSAGPTLETEGTCKYELSDFCSPAKSARLPTKGTTHFYQHVIFRLTADSAGISLFIWRRFTRGNVSLNSARCYLFETETAACK
jgi:hypothetical protein